MEFGQKIFREIDLFDFTSFFGLDFFKFSGPLWAGEKSTKLKILVLLNSNALPLEPIALEFPQLVAIVPPSHKHKPGLIHLPVGPQRFEEQIGTKHRPVDPL